MDKKTVAQIIQDRAVHGLSYRSLAKKYNFAHSSIYYMLKKKPKKEAKLPALEIAPAESLPEYKHIKRRAAQSPADDRIAGSHARYIQ
jgi:transposase-like protein